MSAAAKQKDMEIVRLAQDPADGDDPVYGAETKIGEQAYLAMAQFMSLEEPSTVKNDESQISGIRPCLPTTTPAPLPTFVNDDISSEPTRLVQGWGSAADAPAASSVAIIVAPPPVLSAPLVEPARQASLKPNVFAIVGCIAAVVLLNPLVVLGTCLLLGL